MSEERYELRDGRLIPLSPTTFHPLSGERDPEPLRRVASALREKRRAERWAEWLWEGLAMALAAILVAFMLWATFVAVSVP